MTQETTQAGLTRRQVLKAGGAAAAAGYALSVETVLAQAIKTDTQGIVAGDQVVQIGSYGMNVYEARPASGSNHPILLVVSEIWGVHEYVKDCARRFAKEGFYAVAPEVFQREGDVKSMPNVQDALKIVLAVPREQMLGDAAAAVDWAKTRPNVRKDRVGELVRQAGNPNVEIVVYPEAPHGFHAADRPSYRAAAAADAWQKCNEWFRKHLA